MTTDDFLKKLEEPRGKVELQSSVLSPGARTLRYALLGGLKSVLPKGTVIDGIELQRIDADWQGETEWVMLLDSCVVHLRLDTIGRPRRYRLKVESIRSRRCSASTQRQSIRRKCNWCKFVRQRSP